MWETRAFVHYSPKRRVLHAPYELETAVNQQVSDLVAAYIRGARANGMLTTVKHFPGHGDTATDSHLGVAQVTGDQARLESLELPPFCNAPLFRNPQLLQHRNRAQAEEKQSCAEQADSLRPARTQSSNPFPKRSSA